MKSRALASLFFAGMFLCVLAAAQNQPEEKPNPLFFVKIAGNIAGNVQHNSLGGYLAIYVSDQDWASGLKDSDLGPFLKLKEVKPGRSAVFIYSSGKDAAICVSFDGKSPFGVVAVQAASGGSIQPADIAAAYKDVSKDMLKKSSQELQFNESQINTDDGVALPAYQIGK